MNLQHSRIEQLCDVLKLERIASEWPAIAQQCAREDASHSDFLERLLGTENDARIERQRAALMKTATLPSIKTIEDMTLPLQAARLALRFKNWPP